MGMIIEIPRDKKRLFGKMVDSTLCIKNSIRKMENKLAVFPINLLQYDYEVQGSYYYPYWVGSIRTSIERGLYMKPKVIYYEVICNARNKEDYIVLRSVPAMISIKCKDEEILDYNVNRDEFTNSIIENAKKERIDKQFMFGQPDKETHEVRMVYIPVLKLKVKRKNNLKYSEFYVNQITAQIM